MGASAPIPHRSLGPDDGVGDLCACARGQPFVVSPIYSPVGSTKGLTQPGGFTTFSAFGLETLLLSRTRSGTHAALDVAVQLIGGLAAVWAGYQLGFART
jgi:hypothetical protein